jgi:hypothetical protein
MADTSRVLLERYGPQAQKGKPQLVPVSAVVLGGPGSGRTELAQRLCDDFECVLISPERAIESLLTDTATCALSVQINELLEKGRAIPKRHIVQALQHAMLSTRAQSHGFVLDGFPQTLDDVKVLEEVGIRPRSVFHLVGCATTDAATDQSSYAEAARWRTFDEHTPGILQWYTDEYDCVTELDGARSRWWLATEAAETIVEQLTCEHAYVAARLAEIPAPVNRVGYSRAEITEDLSDFGMYCPVHWLDHSELVCVDESDTQFTVLYMKRFYKLADKVGFSKFTANPEKYIEARLPTFLPVRKNAADVKMCFPKPIKWAGFCPVTYVANGRRYSAIQVGSNDFAVEYKSGFYVFVVSYSP